MANQVYHLKRGVWEITYACNMCCKHCGSSCGEPLPNELTTTAALQLCDDLAAMGMQAVTLSGGEPFLRPDWHIIAQRLSQNGISTNIISNGWCITNDLLDKAFTAKISNVAISLDGYKKNHDFIRKQGSYERVIAALKLLQQRQMSSACVTSINRKTIADLPKMKKEFIKYGVQMWQLQLAMPMGNLLQHQDLILTPTDIPEIIEFCHQTTQEGQLIIHLGDNLGYYSQKYNEITQNFNSLYNPQCGNCQWSGCRAGKELIGIRADGNIYGCLAIRDNNYLAGNINQTPIQQIWYQPQAFAWNRQLKKEQLQGFCNKCQHGDVCLGGCSAQKLTFGNSIHAENPNCLYKLEMEKIIAEATKLTDRNEFIVKAQQHVANKSYQAAEIYTAKALELFPNDVYFHNFSAFVHFFLGNYSTALKHSEFVLAAEPNNVYALKGKGLCLHKLKKSNEGIEFMQRALAQANQNELADICHDLMSVFEEQNQYLCSAIAEQSF